MFRFAPPSLSGPLVLASLLLAACGQPDHAQGPGEVTAGEARALDEAAEMIEQQRLPQEALAEPGAAQENGQGEEPAT